MIRDIPEERLERLRAQVLIWAKRTRSLGLDGLLGGLLDAAAPLSPIGASALWIAQPALGVFLSREAIGDLAHILADSEGVIWLRKALAGEDSGDVSDDADEDG
jgi:hypothetical protein